MPRTPGSVGGYSSSPHNRKDIATQLFEAKSALDQLRTELQQERARRRAAEDEVAVLRKGVAPELVPQSPSHRDQQQPGPGVSPRRRNTHCAGQPQSPRQAGGWRELRDAHRRKIIAARACVVCGRDDRAGEQRAKGFKCHQCVGLPSNPNFVREIEMASGVAKGRDEQGTFVAGDYAFLRALGEGAFGKVRLAEHNRTRQQYAVKCLSKVGLAARSGGNRHRRRADPLKPVRDEIAIMKRLDHPNVIQIFGTMETETDIMIIMEFLPGGQVFPTKLPAPPLPLPRLKRQVCGIVRGLEYLHDNGIIHRDIKPENILLDKLGNVKLADFGVSTKVPDDSETMRVWGFIGTPAFMPPEAFGEVCMEGEATDVWALGVTVYVMAFGRLPWPEVKNLQELGEAIKTHTIEFNHESAEVNDCLEQMLNRDPSERIYVHKIMQHPFISDVRIRKRHPVEEKDIAIVWDPSQERLHLARPPPLGSPGPGASPGPVPLGSPGREGSRSPLANSSLSGVPCQLCKKCAGGGCAECGRDGAALFRSFFSYSKGPYVIIPGNSYELNIVDKGRDPRTRKHDRESEAASPTMTSMRKSLNISRVNWTDKEFDEFDKHAQSCTQEKPTPTISSSGNRRPSRETPDATQGSAD